MRLARRHRSRLSRYASSRARSSQVEFFELANALLRAIGPLRFVLGAAGFMLGAFGFVLRAFGFVLGAIRAFGVGREKFAAAKARPEANTTLSSLSLASQVATERHRTHARVVTLKRQLKGAALPRAAPDLPQKAIATVGLRVGVRVGVRVANGIEHNQLAGACFFIQHRRRRVVFADVGTDDFEAKEGGPTSQSFQLGSTRDCATPERT